MVYAANFRVWTKTLLTDINFRDGKRKGVEIYGPPIGPRTILLVSGSNAIAQKSSGYAGSVRRLPTKMETGRAKAQLAGA